MSRFNDKFERASDTPLSWHNSSTDLRSAAAAVWWAMSAGQRETIAAKCGLGEGFDLRVAGRPGYEMLCGMSLELLYKAIAVAKRKKILTHHRLVELSEYVGIESDAREKGLLGILTQAIKWSGRYPIPKERRDWDQTAHLRTEHLYTKVPLGSFSVLRPNGELDWLSFNELWLKADQVYWEHHYDS